LRREAADIPAVGSQGRGMITLAFGLPAYREQAKTLARSLVLHAPDLPRAIVTDHPADDLKALFHYVIPFRAEYGHNLQQKLQLDHYSPFQLTLYIDSDCIAVRSLDFIFDRFRGHAFGVVGRREFQPGETDWSFDVNRVMSHFGLRALPKFNGGLYYFDRSDRAVAIFDTARSLVSRYVDIGFFQVSGGGPNEERLFSVALALHHLSVYRDNGMIMRTPLGLVGRLRIDTLREQCTFRKNGMLVSPALVHFAAPWNKHPLYRREATKLKLALSNCYLLRKLCRMYPEMAYPFVAMTSWTAMRCAAASAFRLVRMKVRGKCG
jgi:hypothetical protein